MEISKERIHEIITQAVNYGVYSERCTPFYHDFYHENTEPSDLNITANEYADTILKLLTFGKK